MRDLSLHLMDIMQNSVAAGADGIFVEIAVDAIRDELVIIVKDNGSGMDEELLQRVTSPFATTRNTRKVGLGIPLFMASAHNASGNFTIRSVKGKGTEVEASFKISHIDRPPLGEVAETIVTMILSNPSMQIELELINNQLYFRFNTREIKEKLGDAEITNYEVLEWIKGFIEEGINYTFGGVLDEVNS